MKVQAKAKTIRIAPRKARLTIDLIRGKDVAEAADILNNLNNKASRILIKVLNSAVANATNNHELNAEALVVEEAYVDEGPTMKRMKAGARGQGKPRLKRTSHITIIVGEKN